MTCCVPKGAIARRGQPCGCSTSGAWGLASGASSILAVRSAALSRRRAATSALVVAFANLSRVEAWSARYFFPTMSFGPHNWILFRVTTQETGIRSGRYVQKCTQCESGHFRVPMPASSKD